LFGGGFGYETDPDTGLIWNGEKIYLPDIGRFIGRFNSSASTGGGYAPVGNNPNTSSSGPIAERVADIAEGGNNTTYVGFEPLDPGDPEYLPPVFAGFTGWAWGKDADQIKSDLVHAGVRAIVDHPMLPFLAGKIISKIPRPAKAIVIGENMKERVIPFAAKYGLQYFVPKLPAGAPKWLQMIENAIWLTGKVLLGYAVYDRGIDVYRDKRSMFYRMEKFLLKAFGKEVIDVSYF
jgi:hypothetical protein